MKKWTLWSCLFLVTSFMQAQNSSIWQLTKQDDLPDLGERKIIPNKGRVFELDTLSFLNQLAAAPHESEVDVRSSTCLIRLPHPNGGFEDFTIVSYDMMEPGLRQVWWYIRTWRGVSKQNPGISIRLDWTVRGLHVMALGDDNGSWFIDPYFWNNNSYYQTYFKKDYPAPAEPFECHTEADEGYRPAPGTARNGDCQLRSYRLALACTGEYAAFHGGTVAGAASAMATSMNRLNGVYERELAMRLILVANNNDVIYLNASTDPYTNNSGSTMLGENQTTLNNVIGSANYDIGHVYSTGGGGVASLRSPCTGSKARGVTGRGSPVGDAFDIDYVAHEMGHQFGGNHTQNNNCNRAASASMEPGSASSIMGYAGICSPNVQSNSDDYYHGISIQEIANYMELGGGNTCSTPVGAAGTNPSVTAVPDYSIPQGTPFALTTTASGTGTITYNWEQWDPEVGATMPPASTNTQGPMFRTFPSSSSPTRYFPRLTDLVNNTSFDWEELPTVARDMDFRVTVRDFNGTYGCTISDNTLLSVIATPAPFSVAYPNVSSVEWEEGLQYTVEWNVSGTTASPISAANVSIMLSYDGGLTYPVTLAASTPNDGSQAVMVPPGISSTARIKVQPVNNVFFDISDQNFSIIAAQSASYLMEYNGAGEAICESENSLQFIVETSSLGGFSTPINLNYQGGVAGLNLSFSPNPVVPGSPSTVTVSGLSSLNAGNYTLHIQADGNGNLQSASVPLTVLSLPGQGLLSTPSQNEAGVSVQPAFNWNDDANADEYLLEVATSAAFTNIVISEIVTVSEFNAATTLNPASYYYWRVTPMSTDCGAGASSVARVFSTESCHIFNSTNVPVAISSGAPATYNSTLTINDTGTITDVDVINLNGTHTWVGDLTVILESPDEKQAVLIDQICGNVDDFSISFNDQSTLSAPCPPSSANAVLPESPLSVFNTLDMAGVWTLQITDNANQDGGQLLGWGLKICTDNLPALPVEWLGFNAQYNRQFSHVALRWATASETDNKGFFIERMEQGKTVFETIGWAEATTDAEGKGTYAHLDTDVLNGHTYYYRLKQEDYSGTHSYSAIRTVKVADLQEQDFNIFPNPADNQVTLSWTAHQVTLGRIVDARGAVVATFSPHDSNTHQLDCSALPEGIYLILLDSAQGTLRQQLIIGR